MRKQLKLRDASANNSVKKGMPAKDAAKVAEKPSSPADAKETVEVMRPYLYTHYTH